jgi:hypothetical protein
VLACRELTSTGTSAHPSANAKCPSTGIGHHKVGVAAPLRRGGYAAQTTVGLLNFSSWCAFNDR